MAKFKVIVSDPQAGTSKVVEVEEARAAPFIGKKIGEVMDGAVVDMAGMKMQLMGGSDKDGVPMRPSVHGGVRRKVVLSGGVGYQPTRKGGRKRKAVRGNIVTDEIVQLNMKLVDQPPMSKEAIEAKKAKKLKAPKPEAAPAAPA